MHPQHCPLPPLNHLFSTLDPTMSNDRPERRPPFPPPDAPSFLEADSLHGTDEDELDIDTASITSSIVDYEYENGRRYHAYKAGHYPLPNDEPELDRLDLQHHVITLLLKGNLHLAPLDNPRRALDIGTGTGLWAIEFADRFPTASVIGTDLSPVQPLLVPDNVSFEVNDAEGDWFMKENHFDFIHSRFMIGSLGDYQSTIAKAYHHLKPGGYLEIQEMDPRVTSDDGTHNDGPWHVGMIRDLCDASGKYGKPVPPHTEYGRWLRKQGFVDVKENFFKVPINTWPKDKVLKEIGKYQCLHYNEGLEGICIGLFTRVLGWTHSEFQVLLARVRKELKDRSIHAYQPFCVAVGRKPYPHELRASSVTSDRSSGSVEASQPIGTATHLRSPKSAMNLVDMVRNEMPENRPPVPEIRVNVNIPSATDPTDDVGEVEVDKDTPTERRPVLDPNWY